MSDEIFTPLTKMPDLSWAKCAKEKKPPLVALRNYLLVALEEHESQVTDEDKICVAILKDALIKIISKP